MIYFVLSSGKSGWKEKNGERRDFFSSFYESRLIHEFHSDSSFAIYASRREFFSRRLDFLFLWGSRGSSRILIRHFVEGWLRIFLLLCKVRLIIIIDEIECVPKHLRNRHVVAGSIESGLRVEHNACAFRSSHSNAIFKLFLPIFFIVHSNISEKLNLKIKFFPLLFYLFSWCVFAQS